MRIGSVTIKDLLSIKEAKITFGNSGVVLVDGWNFDDDTANGAGKSAIFNCVAFALYNKVPRDITITKMLRDEAKQGCVVVDGIQTSNGVWSVERHRPARVKFFKDNIEQDISQEEFENNLGLNYSQFLISMYSAQTKGQTFLSLNDTGKKDFLLKLMNLQQFADVKQQADKDIKQVQQDIATIELEQAKIQSRIEAYSENMVDIDQLQKEVKAYDDAIANYNSQIEELSQVPEPDMSDFNKLEDEIVDTKMRLGTATTMRTSLVAKFKDVVNQIKEANEISLPGSEATCPECNQKVRVVDEEIISYSDQQGILEKNAKYIEDLKDEARAIKKQIDEQDVVLSKKDELIVLEDKLNSKKANRRKKYEDSRKKIAELNALNIQSRTSKKYTIEQIKVVKDRQLYTKSAQKDLANFSSNLSLRKQDLELLQTVAHIYSPTGAPAYIMDSIVDAFNDKISQYIEMIWPNAVYCLQSFKENAKGDVRAKFSEKLTISGKDKQIGSLSGGQVACLSMATFFALLDVIAERFALDLNPIILDEQFTGLDATNKERVIELLEKIAQDRQIWVIDHASETKTLFSHVVRVELKDGVSTIHTMI